MDTQPVVTDATEIKSGEVETVTTQNTGTEAQVTEAEKMFTQAEIDEIVKQRVDRERKKFEKANPQEEVEQLRNELTRYKNEIEMSRYNVNDDFKDYVMFKVNGVKDKDFATALKDFFADEANKKYLKEEAKPITMPRPNNIGQSPDLDIIKKKYGDVMPLNKGRQ